MTQGIQQHQRGAGDISQPQLLAIHNRAVALDETASRCRMLWLAVIHEQWELSMSGGYVSTKHDRTEARRWMRGRAFREVAELAGVDPDYALRKFEEQLAAMLAGEKRGQRGGRRLLEVRPKAARDRRAGAA